MTREETQNLLAMIQATYPNFNPPDRTAAVNAWRMALSDCEWDTVQRAFAYKFQRLCAFSRTDYGKNHAVNFSTRNE